MLSKNSGLGRSPGSALGWNHPQNLLVFGRHHTAAVMSRIQSAKLKGYDPYVYLRNIQDGRAQQVLPLNEGLPMHPVQCQHCFDRPT